MILEIVDPLPTQSSSKSLSIKSKSNSPSRTSSFSPSRNIVIPTSSIDICSNNECDVGFDELDLSNNDNYNDNNNDNNNNESILELISNNGNNVGTLIIPNNIVSEDSTISVSFVTGSNSLISNDIRLGNTIADIVIKDIFNSEIKNLENSLTICFEQQEDELDVCIIFYILCF